MVLSMSYLLQGPQGVYERFNLLLVIKGKEFVYRILHLAASALLKEEVEEREPSHDFVLLIQFNGVDLLHLPPLQKNNTANHHSPLLSVNGSNLIN